MIMDITIPGCSIFNSPDGHEQMTLDIQGLLPWIREGRTNAAKLWCALANVMWKKGEVCFSVTLRGAGAYVGELYYGSEKYASDATSYIEFYCCGETAAIDAHIYTYLTEQGWRPYGY